MDRGFVAVLGSISSVVGWPLFAISRGVSPAATVVSIAFIAAGTSCFLLWVVATGVVIGMREVHSEREQGTQVP